MSKNNTLATKEELKAEAIKRLEMFNLHHDVVPYFKETNNIHVSEMQVILGSAVGVLFWLNQYEDRYKAVKEFENKTGCLVYHVIYYQCTTYGKNMVLLFVSPDKEAWEAERLLLTRGVAAAHVIKMDNPALSEMGMVGIAASGGGFIRIA